MKIQELIAWIEQRAPGTYFPFMFPTTGPDACSVVTLQAGGAKDRDTGASFPAFQVLVRGAARDFEETEVRAYAIFTTIANRKEQRIGAESVVVIYPVGSVPFFIGIDEVQRPVFSMNFNLIIRP
ncbi:minor capsid protein [Paenibacillus larvae]|uniref:minor capsid protein n=1 Tax=Paenibacillus larvae TaxID=1464 RepID=UPI0001694602|nr:minor capsid protein [Paenibacillus larvae]